MCTGADRGRDSAIRTRGCCSSASPPPAVRTWPPVQAAERPDAHGLLSPEPAEHQYREAHVRNDERRVRPRPPGAGGAGQSRCEMKEGGDVGNLPPEIVADRRRTA